eukprot:839628_1
MENIKYDHAWFDESLDHFVDSSDNINDLASLLSFIPLNVTKQFIKQQIALFDGNTSRTAHYNSLSIDHLLPSSVTQYCLSFVHDLHLRHVSKSFKKYSEQNQRILLNHLKEIANQQPFDHQIVFNEEINTTYVVDPSRTSLNETEINLQYQGPYENLVLPMNMCNDGDRILLHGTIDINDGFGYSFYLSKDIQIIGIGDNAILKDVINATMIM